MKQVEEGDLKRALNYPQLQSTDCLPVGICVSGEHQ